MDRKKITEFENKFISQGFDESRSVIETLNLGWKLLSILPREELDRIDTKLLDKYYGGGEDL